MQPLLCCEWDGAEALRPSSCLGKARVRLRLQPRRPRGKRSPSLRAELEVRVLQPGTRRPAGWSVLRARAVHLHQIKGGCSTPAPRRSCLVNSCLCQLHVPVCSSERSRTPRTNKGMETVSGHGLAFLLRSQTSASLGSGLGMPCPTGSCAGRC